MFIHEREALKDAIHALRSRLHGKLVSAHAFGSRVRGSHDEWSDFDLLVVVDGRTRESVMSYITPDKAIMSYEM